MQVILEGGEGDRVRPEVGAAPEVGQAPGDLVGNVSPGQAPGVPPLYHGEDDRAHHEARDDDRKPGERKSLAPALTRLATRCLGRRSLSDLLVRALPFEPGRLRALPRRLLAFAMVRAPLDDGSGQRVVEDLIRR